MSTKGNKEEETGGVASFNDKSDEYNNLVMPPAPTINITSNASATSNNQNKVESAENENAKNNAPFSTVSLTTTDVGVKKLTAELEKLGINRKKDAAEIIINNGGTNELQCFESTDIPVNAMLSDNKVSLYSLPQMGASALAAEKREQEKLKRFFSSPLPDPDYSPVKLEWPAKPGEPGAEVINMNYLRQLGKKPTPGGGDRQPPPNQQLDGQHSSNFTPATFPFGNLPPPPQLQGAPPAFVNNPFLRFQPQIMPSAGPSFPFPIGTYPFGHLPLPQALAAPASVVNYPFLTLQPPFVPLSGPSLPLPGSGNDNIVRPDIVPFSVFSNATGMHFSPVPGSQPHRPVILPSMDDDSSAFSAVSDSRSVGGYRNAVDFNPGLQSPVIHTHANGFIGRANDPPATTESILQTGSNSVGTFPLQPPSSIEDFASLVSQNVLVTFGKEEDNICRKFFLDTTSAKEERKMCPYSVTLYVDATKLSNYTNIEESLGLWKNCSFTQFYRSIIAIRCEKENKPIHYLQRAADDFVKKKTSRKDEEDRESFSYIQKLWNEGSGVILVQICSYVSLQEAKLRRNCILTALEEKDMTKYDNNVVFKPEWGNSKHLGFRSLLDGYQIYKADRCKPLYLRDVKSCNK